MNKTILIFIIIFLLIYYSTFKTEYLNVNSEENDAKKSDINKIDMLNDPLFKDVIFYQNDDDVYSPGKKTGLEKCLDVCIGKCVEFGITGATFCFPNKN